MVTGHCHSERGVDIGYSSPFGRLGRQVTAWVGAVDWQACVVGVEWILGDYIISLVVEKMGMRDETRLDALVCQVGNGLGGCGEYWKAVFLFHWQY